MNLKLRVTLAALCMAIIGVFATVSVAAEVATDKAPVVEAVGSCYNKKIVTYTLPNYWTITCSGTGTVEFAWHCKDPDTGQNRLFSRRISRAGAASTYRQNCDWTFLWINGTYVGWVS